MAIKEYNHIECDGPDCEHNLTFDPKNKQVEFAKPENIWLKTGRLVSTNDQRALFYCCDVCEINGTRTGQHNIPEPKQVVVGDNMSVQAAAKAAEAAKASDKALKSGDGGPVILP